MEDTLKEKTAKGLFWGGIGSGAQQLIGVVFGIFLARILNADDYGLVGMLAIFTGIASTIINGGFLVALTNKQDVTHEDYNAVFWFTLFASAILYVLLFFSAPLIAKFYGRPELTNLSRVVFLGFFGVTSIVPHTVMFKQLMVKKQALIAIISLLLSGIVGIALALNDYGYWALALQTVIYIFAVAILRYIMASWKPTFNFDFRPLKQMLPFSVKIFITDIFIHINNNIFAVLFGKFYNATQVGYYSQGQKWATMGSSFIGGMINSVAQPVLVQVNAERERQVAILRKMIRFGAFVSFPLMLGLAFIGKEFILIAIGSKWLSSVPFLQLFCLWGAFGYLWTLFTNLIYTHGKSSIYMYGTIFVGILQLSIVVCLYSYGIFPMVIGYILMYFVGLLLWQYFVKKQIGLRLMDVLKDILPYLLTTLGCLLIAWLITKNIQNLYWLLTLKVLIVAALYVLILWLSKSIIFKESMDMILKRK